MHANIEKGANVEMIQRRNGLSLTLKTCLCFRSRGELLRENFDGDGAIQARIPGFVDFAHAACRWARQSRMDLSSFGAPRAFVGDYTVVLTTLRASDRFRERQNILILRVMTHKDYDKGNQQWKDAL